ncbi:hypothetical protein HYH02_012999 [Chlamydomonas schloesseri]|uniref:Uncharacterized protein n=1 Tax=Chlamydomonas schloesseri TaxID=2026947 RepID=A0A835SSN9_9CHLO|nr:hypothetical protein HYH02_012999 [Chlamydomonas schloesseri]|eukprot:KAG2432428.1 hypothetical protein HYH02_012999 [Chlamydomonas schloesseri]
MALKDYFPRTKFGVAALAVGSICTLAFTPVVYKMKFAPKVDVSKPLPRSMSTRGAYVNSGSRDAGPDRPVSSKDLE